MASLSALRCTTPSLRACSRSVPAPRLPTSRSASLGSRSLSSSCSSSRGALRATSAIIPSAPPRPPRAWLHPPRESPLSSSLNTTGPRYWSSLARSNHQSPQAAGGRQRRRDWLDSFFNDPFFQTPSLLSDLAKGTHSFPVVDIAESKEGYSIHAELPGLKKEDVKIKLQNNVLTITGEKKMENKVDDKDFLRVERSYGTFSRSFSLPEHTDPTSVKASFRDGVLELTIPKVQPQEPQGHEINIE